MTGTCDTSADTSASPWPCVSTLKIMDNFSNRHKKIISESNFVSKSATSHVKLMLSRDSLGYYLQKLQIQIVRNSKITQVIPDSLMQVKGP